MTSTRVGGRGALTFMAYTHDMRTLSLTSRGRGRVLSCRRTPVRYNWTIPLHLLITPTSGTYDLPYYVSATIVNVVHASWCTSLLSLHSGPRYIHSLVLLEGHDTYICTYVTCRHLHSYLCTYIELIITYRNLRERVSTYSSD